MTYCSNSSHRERFNRDNKKLRTSHKNTKTWEEANDSIGEWKGCEYKEWEIKGVEPNETKMYDIKNYTIFGIEENFVISFENRIYATWRDINKIQRL